jgi:hypothetical protein
VQREQVTISAHDVRSARSDRTLKHAVIIGIPRHGTDYLRRLDQPRVVEDVCLEARYFVLTEPELGVAKHTPQLAQ